MAIESTLKCEIKIRIKDTKGKERRYQEFWPRLLGGIDSQTLSDTKDPLKST